MFRLTVVLCFIVLSVSNSDFDPATLALNDDVVAALFPKNCPIGESWKHEKSLGVELHCLFQKGRFDDEFSKFATDAESLGCKVDRGLIKYMTDNFAKTAYASNPIAQRIGEDCGFCGVKPSCCGTKQAQKTATTLSAKHPEIDGVSAFYFQSIKALPCSRSSSRVCTVTPLSPAEFDKIAQLQPFTKNIDRSDDCNLAQFGLAEWEAAQSSSSFPVAAPLYNRFLCRSMQTNKPRLNCIKNPSTKQCMCCCHSYTPVKKGSQYSCVQKNDKETETICATI